MLLPPRGLLLGAAVQAGALVAAEAAVAAAAVPARGGRPRGAPIRLRRRRTSSEINAAEHARPPKRLGRPRALADVAFATLVGVPSREMAAVGVAMCCGDGQSNPQQKRAAVAGEVNFIILVQGRGR